MLKYDKLLVNFFKKFEDNMICEKCKLWWAYDEI